MQRISCCPTSPTRTMFFLFHSHFLPSSTVFYPCLPSNCIQWAHGLLVFRISGGFFVEMQCKREKGACLQCWCASGRAQTGPARARADRTGPGSCVNFEISVNFFHDLHCDSEFSFVKKYFSSQLSVFVYRILRLNTRNSFFEILAKIIIFLNIEQ